MPSREVILRLCGEPTAIGGDEMLIEVRGVGLSSETKRS